jgi:hypothetical protein
VLGRMYRASVSSVFRHGTIWFRHLRQHRGWRFAICGSNPALVVCARFVLPLAGKIEASGLSRLQHMESGGGARGPSPPKNLADGSLNADRTV